MFTIQISAPLAMQDSPFPLLVVNVVATNGDQRVARSLAFPAKKWDDLATLKCQREMRDTIDEPVRALLVQMYSVDLDLVSVVR